MTWYRKAKLEYSDMKIFSQRKYQIDNWVDVNSSFIVSVGFNEEGGILGIRMGSGKDYYYSGVPNTVYKDFLNSPSKGQFFTKSIKDSYQLV